MIRLGKILAVCALAAGATGCATARKETYATDVRLRLSVSSPERYRVRVATHSTTNEFAVTGSGRATVHVPAMGPGCSSHLFGVIQVYDKSPAAWRVVHILQDDKIVRRLSLKQVSRLPVDDDGYHTVRVW